MLLLMMINLSARSSRDAVRAPERDRAVRAAAAARWLLGKGRRRVGTLPALLRTEPGEHLNDLHGQTDRFRRAWAPTRRAPPNANLVRGSDFGQIGPSGFRGRYGRCPELRFSKNV